MIFDRAFIFRLIKMSFLGTKDSPANLSFYRLFCLLLVFPVFFVDQAAHRIGFFLDRIFYPKFKNIKIEQPVFIVGVPRSGTTYLHRLMAKDEKRFTTMMLWELLFAPSIVQKKILLFCASIDSFLGSPIKRLILKLEQRGYTNIRTMHKVSFFETEEDEVLLLHACATIYLKFFFPFEDSRFDDLIRFDTNLSEKDRRRIMKFYKGCIRRHLYVFGKGKQFLSKNPAASAKILSLRENFPDAHFIWTVRSPVNVIPSTASLVAQILGMFNTLPAKFPLMDHVHDMLGHWYRYPNQVASDWPKEAFAEVKYEQLILETKDVLDTIYRQFGFEMEPAFSALLETETQRQNGYSSNHRYSLEMLCEDPKEVIERYKDIFERYNFESPLIEPGHKKAAC